MTRSFKVAAFVALIGFAVLAAGILSSCGGGGGGGGVQTYDVTVTTGLTGGSLTTTHGVAAVGTKVTVTATPEDNYTLTNGSITVTETGGAQKPPFEGGNKNIWTFIMPAYDVTVNAAFESVTSGNHLITTSVSTPGGSIGVAGSKTGGTTGVPITVTPDEGYQPKSGTPKVLKTEDSSDVSLAVSLSGSDLSYTFTMPDYAVTVSAEFEAKSYNITKASMTNGGVTVAAATAPYRSTVTLTIAPETYYRLKAGTLKVAKNGAPGTTVTVNGTGNTRTFTMPAFDVEVSAEFEFIPVGGVKTFTLTGITDAQLALGETYVLFGLYKPGTLEATVKSDGVAYFTNGMPSNDLVAYIGGKNPTITGGSDNWTISATLHDVNGGTWTGYGVYDVWLLLRDISGKWTGYKKADLPVAGSITRPASEYGSPVFTGYTP